MKNLIYSNNRIDELEGTYNDPSLFVKLRGGFDRVYTDSQDIAKAYEAKGVEVRPITKKTRAKKDA